MVVAPSTSAVPAAAPATSTPDPPSRRRPGAGPTSTGQPAFRTPTPQRLHHRAHQRKKRYAGAITSASFTSAGAAMLVSGGTGRGDRFIASRKASRLDLDFKGVDGPSSVEFVRGTLQPRGGDCCGQPCCEWCGRGAMGVSSNGSFYKVAAASVLLGLEGDTAALCRELEASCDDSTPVCHRFTPRVLRFQGGGKAAASCTSSSPDTVIPCGSAASAESPLRHQRPNCHQGDGRHHAPAEGGGAGRCAGAGGVGEMLHASRGGLAPLAAATQRLLAKPSLRERHVADKSYRSLDAPGLADDFYLSLLDWSPAVPGGDSFLAVGLGPLVYIQSQDGRGNVTCLNKTKKPGSSNSDGGGRGGQPQQRPGHRTAAAASGPIPSVLPHGGTPTVTTTPPPSRAPGRSDDGGDGSGGGGGGLPAPTHGRSHSLTADAQHLRDNVTAVAWSKVRTHTLALGHASGLLQIWDAQRQTVVHTMAPGSERPLFCSSSRQAGTPTPTPLLRRATPATPASPCRKRVTTVAWLGGSPHVCLFGRSSSFYQVDLRCGSGGGKGGNGAHSLEPGAARWSGVVRRFRGHTGEVCGLEVAPDDVMVASGSNDNTVAIWDLRRSSSGGSGHSSSHRGRGEPRRHPAPGPGGPVARYTDHTAATKALAWSPHTRGVLATGGGTADRTIRIRNTLLAAAPTDAAHTIHTGAQVCKLLWSRSTDEFVSAHGYSTNEVVVWRYSDFGRVATVRDNDRRVVHMALSPCGRRVVVGSDEVIRFFDLFPHARATRAWGAGGSGGGRDNVVQSFGQEQPAAKQVAATPCEWGLSGAFAKRLLLR